MVCKERNYSGSLSPSQKKKKVLTELPEKYLCLFLLHSGRVFAVVAAISSFGFCEGFFFACLFVVAAVV